MKKCLKIQMQVEPSKSQENNEVIAHFVEKQAKKLNLEGSVQMNEDLHTAVIFVNGLLDQVEEFVDQVYKGNTAVKPVMVEVEPALGERDFRGVFRVIVE